MSDNETKTPRRFRRGIYFLPSLLTLLAMMAGFFSIVEAVKYQNCCFYPGHEEQRILHLQLACYAIFIAMIFDGLDGRVARMASVQSDFGAELDSLSDLISFGLAPALLVYFSLFQHLGRIGWLVSFLYAACVALRLARFNSKKENSNKRYFFGLSSPLAAGMIVSYVLVLCHFGLQDHVGYRLAILVSLPLVSLLTVSRLRYRSFKDNDLRGKVPFVLLMLVLIILVCLVYMPSVVLFLFFFTYGISGPLTFAINFLKRKTR